MKKVYLEKMRVINYRNFSDLSLDLGDGINIIIGQNGSGKTNILESVSLLSPGKGLKSATFDDICKFGEGSWQTNFRIQSKLGSSEIETSFSSTPRSRKINYNGSRLSSTEFTNLLNVIWLTPQMEGLFLGAASDRRKFLDRIVYNFDRTHAKRVTAYEHYMRERNRLFTQGDYLSQTSWLTTIEEKMAIEAKGVDDARRAAIIHMQEVINELDTQFPKANLEISNLSDDRDECGDFLSYYTSKLEACRQKDSYSGRTSFGVHKSDLNVFHKGQGRAARLCSTGEQKALLISVVLASIESVLKNTKTTPILLLDELFVHLDDSRKKHLADYILESNLQTFITTTDIIGIEELARNAHIIEL